MNIDKIFLVDYSCHPFTLDLAKKISQEGFQINFFFSKEVNLTGNFYKFYKNNFNLR